MIAHLCLLFQVFCVSGTQRYHKLKKKKKRKVVNLQREYYMNRLNELFISEKLTICWHLVHRKLYSFRVYFGGKFSLRLSRPHCWKFTIIVFPKRFALLLQCWVLHTTPSFPRCVTDRQIQTPRCSRKHKFTTTTIQLSTKT